MPWPALTPPSGQNTTISLDHIFRNRPGYRAGTTPSIFPYAAGTLAIVIFVIDTLTDLEIAFPVFYIAVVLISVSFLEKRGVMVVSLACMALTILSFFLTPSGAAEAGLINCVISLSAIATSTYLVLKIESAEVAAHEARAHLAREQRVRHVAQHREAMRARPVEFAQSVAVSHVTPLVRK